VYEYIRTSKPCQRLPPGVRTPVLAAGCQRLPLGEREHAFGGTGCQSLLKGKLQLTFKIKCQVALSFFYGHLTNILGHLGHEYQQ